MLLSTFVRPIVPTGLAGVTRAVSLGGLSPTLHAMPCAGVVSARSMGKLHRPMHPGTTKRIPRGGHRLDMAKAQPVRWKTKREVLLRKYKLKTHQGAKKRFKLRGDGSWVYTAPGKKHLMAGASRSRQTLGKLKKRVVTVPTMIKKLHKLMPYHTKRATRRA